MSWCCCSQGQNDKNEVSVTEQGSLPHEGVDFSSEYGSFVRVKGINLPLTFLSEDKSKIYMDLKKSTERKGFMNKHLFATKKVRIYNLSSTAMLLNCSLFKGDNLITKAGGGVTATGISGNVELDNSKNEITEIVKMDPNTVKVIRNVDYAILDIFIDATTPKEIIRRSRKIISGEEYLIITKEFALKT